MPLPFTSEIDGSERARLAWNRPSRNVTPNRRATRVGRLRSVVHVLDILAGIAALMGPLGGRSAGVGEPSLELSWLTRIDVSTVTILLIWTAAWQLILRIAQRSVEGSAITWKRELSMVLCASSAGFVVLLGLALANAAPPVGIAQSLQTGALLAALTALNHVSVIAAMSGLSSLYPEKKNCIIIGSGPRALAIYRFLQNSPSISYHVVGFVDQLGPHAVYAEIRDRLIGNISELRAILMGTAIDEVFLAMPVRSCYNDIQRAIHLCEEAGIACKLPSDLFACSMATIRVEEQGSRSLLTMHVVRNDYGRLLKGMLDMSVSAALLLLLALPFLVLALAVRLTSPGPALFVQRRYGLNKRLFKMYKFRTMYVNAEQMQAQLEKFNEMGGPVFKIRNDPRITPIGRFLRKTSIDELPQLWNVLIGDMSLVGPRPLPVRDVARFNQASLMRRFSVKPGLTCLWQISGRSGTTFERWMELDLRYIDQWSILLDLKILAKTVPVVLLGRGAV